jgi:hypothetical protein
VKGMYYDWSVRVYINLSVIDLVLVKHNSTISTSGNNFNSHLHTGAMSVQ